MQASPNRIQEIEERMSGSKDTIENINNSQRKCKKQKAPNPNNPGNPGHSEKIKPKDNRYKKSEDSQLKGPVNIFKKL